MQQILISKMILSSVSAIAFIGLLAISSPDVHADMTTHHFEGKNEIQIYHSNAKNNFYHVNGKTFNWDDLTPSQQARIKPIQDKMANAEQLFKIQEEKLSFFSKQIEEKAQAIENEVRKLERISIQFNNESIELNDINKLTNEFSKLSSVNHQALRLNETEIQTLQKELNKVDLSLVDELDTHAQELEKVLVEIAKEIEL